MQVRAATPEDRPVILELIREMLPSANPETRWDWLYESNPGGKALTWLAEAPNGEIAGCTSFFPFRIWLDGSEKRAALGGDGYVRPTFRRMGLGSMLHEASRAAMPAHEISCMFGAPGAMNVSPLKRGGSREVGQVARYVRPLRVGPELVGEAIARVTCPRHAPRLEPLRARDTRIDEVWRQARETLGIATVRDASFYDWRFRAAPAQQERPYVVLDGTTPIGACALESLRGGKELHVVDLIAAPDAWHAALRGIVRYATDATAAHSVSIKLFATDARRRHMWRSGFIERATKPFLCMIPRGGDRRFFDPQRWFYGGADSDLDALN